MNTLETELKIALQELSLADAGVKNAEYFLEQLKRNNKPVWHKDHWWFGESVEKRSYDFAIERRIKLSEKVQKLEEAIIIRNNSL